MAEIWTKIPYGKYPNAWSVGWTEYIKESGKVTTQSDEGEVYRIRKVERFDNYNEAETFFLKKVQEKLALYKKEEIKK